MLKFHFKSAYRNLINGGIYSGINLIGLSFGLAVFMLILLFVDHEYHYDSFHKNSDRIYLMTAKMKDGDQLFTSKFMSYGTAQIARNSIPGIESYLRLSTPMGAPPIVEVNSNVSFQFLENKFFFADNNFFEFFSFPLISGDASKVLTDPFSVVIAENAVSKYFSHGDPIGKTIKYNDKFIFRITGIAKKIPSNSSLDFDFVASLSSIHAMDSARVNAESNLVQMGSFATYFRLKKNDNHPEKLSVDLLQLYNAGMKEKQNELSFDAVQLGNIHTEIKTAQDGSLRYLKIFPFVAALILLMAIINYISLATARFTIRAKDIGVRKVVGARKLDIIVQFYVESALTVILSFIGGFVLLLILKSRFYKFVDINIDNSFLFSPSFISLLILLLFAITIIAAAYPSFLLSSFKPALILYGKLSKNGIGSGIRKACIIFQFIVAIILTSFGVTIKKQLKYLAARDTGLNRQNVVMIPFDTAIGKKYYAFKQKIKSIPGIEGVATAHYPLYKGYDTYYAESKSKPEGLPIAIIDADQQFINIMGLSWKTAPDDKYYYSQRGNVILNETALNSLDLDKNSLHQKLVISNKTYNLSGVLRDFNYESLQTKIGSMAIIIHEDDDSVSLWSSEGGCMMVKIDRAEHFPQVLNKLEILFKNSSPVKPYEYYFLEDSFNQLYKSEKELGWLMWFFIILALLIACIGLFGLSTFVAQQRTKEIAIRKILGASIGQLAILLTKEFFSIVVIASIIAIPIAWLEIDYWLQSFAYRANIEWYLFLLAIIGIFFVSLLTISFHIIKTASLNPIYNLRNE